MHHVQRASKFVPVIFASNEISPGSIIGNCRLKIGGCVGGPFLTRRLSTRVNTLLGVGQKVKTTGRDRVCQVNRGCAFSTIRTMLGRSSYMRGAVARHRTGLLRVLYGGGGRLIEQSVVLSEL